MIKIASSLYSAIINTMFARYVQKRLENYVKKYFEKHQPVLIAVVGSVGKTTTKTAIGTILAKKYRIQLEPGNHNTPLSVPLAIMGVKYPPLELVRKISTWRHVFKAMAKRVNDDQGVDVIIQELGTDHPGDLAVYERYLRPSITVVTSISPEHMENFPNGLDDVAREELSITAYSDYTIVNHDDIDDRYAEFAQTSNIADYGIDGGEYRLRVVGGSPLTGYTVEIIAPELSAPVQAVLHVVGNHMIKSVCAGIAVALRLGMSVNDIVDAVDEIRPVSGRMNPLRGRNDMVIIDDTYNSSPLAATAALDTLYQIEAPQRIAILGSMNELGAYSESGHQTVGDYCDPSYLDMVVTIGEDAEKYLAPAAHRRGCAVRSFADPVSAGTFVDQYADQGAAILVKGSQNGVYAEEATKVMLADAADIPQLVRQDDYWMNKKRDWFAQLSKRDDIDLDEE